MLVYAKEARSALRYVKAAAKTRRVYVWAEEPRLFICARRSHVVFGAWVRSASPTPGEPVRSASVSAHDLSGCIPRKGELRLRYDGGNTFHVAAHESTHAIQAYEATPMTPCLPDGEEINASWTSFWWQLRVCCHSIGRDERASTGQLYVGLEERPDDVAEVTLAATDGYMLSAGGGPCSPDREVLVPRVVAQALPKDVRAGLHMRFLLADAHHSLEIWDRVGYWALWPKSNMMFPLWWPVISRAKERCRNEVGVNEEDLLPLLPKARAGADATVTLSVRQDRVLVVEARSDGATTRAECIAQYVLGEFPRVSFQAHYLRRALERIPGCVTIAAEDGLSPVLFRAGGAYHVVMPAQPGD